LTLGFAALAGCRSGETLDSPAVVDPMFVRYVAMGNSITAGFQSVGINDSTQQRAYPMLLAAAMGTGFAYPSLNMPGCPAPFVNNVTQQRVGGALATDCALRGPTPMWLNNLGVPGNSVGTLLSNFGGLPSVYAPLRLFLLGGYTEVQMMQKIQPTFTTIWIGNNDVLGALTSLTDVGDTNQITPVPQFDAQYDSVASAVAATGSQAVLISVGNVTDLPYASPAGIYYCLKNGGCPAPLPPQNPILGGLPTFTVDANCSPLAGGMSILVPWPIGLGKVDSAAAGAPTVLDCTNQSQVVSPEETAAMVTAITAYNAHIQSVATANGWAYWDVNPVLNAARANGTIPLFPDVSGAFASPPTSVTFGPLFSLDGVHPSSLTHQIVADSLAATINQFYFAGQPMLPVPVCGTVTCPPIN
ncbi:MAG: SGNH/GDSL hydrolase family protein, partial [Gemmatimonadales bacterium]